MLGLRTADLTAAADSIPMHLKRITELLLSKYIRSDSSCAAAPVRAGCAPCDATAASCSVYVSRLELIMWATHESQSLVEQCAVHAKMNRLQ